MRKSLALFSTLLIIYFITHNIPLKSDPGILINIQGIPHNGKLKKSMKCPPGVVPCDNDCTWTLSFTATIRSDDGIDTTSASVDGIDEIVTNNPPLNSCDSNPVTVTETTFSHDFAITCPGIHNSGSHQIYTISFSGVDCSGNSETAEAKLILSCYYCTSDFFAAVDGNGSTEVSHADYDRDVMIQFVILNLNATTETINLEHSGTQGWKIDPPFPPSIVLGSGESEEFLVDVTVPGGSPAGMEEIITLTAEAMDGTEISASDTIYVTEYTSIDPDISRPAAFHLSQNYPNPFNPLTEIKYDLPVDCHVRLDIYNVMGRKVATLVDEKQSSGNKVVKWDGRDGEGIAVSSGIFFYRLQAGNFIEVKKMALLR